MAFDRMYLQLFFLILSALLLGTFCQQLGTQCFKDSQCKVDNSHCFSGVCTCKHYHAPVGNVTCLESKLLGRECLVKQQCSLRVANSTCSNGRCRCSEGFIRFHKHTCLGPAKPGDVCYNDEHCKLWSSNSRCQFLIRKLFGKCICDGACVPDMASSNFTTPYSNKMNGTEATNVKTTTAATSESSNDGELPQQAYQSASKGSEESEKTGLPFADPFVQQKQHLQVASAHVAVTKTPATDSIDTDANETVAEVAAVLDATEASGGEEGKENSVGLDVAKDGSKYRVDAGPKDASLPEVKWSDVKAVSLGYACLSDVECQKRDSQSRCLNGVCDCLFKTNETNSCNSQNTGCGPETFQCRESGICISWFFVCDGRYDCPDKSDEECQAPKCPKVSFRCGNSGTCVSRAVICDGVDNCPNGEDERFCTPDKRNSTQGCPDHTFQCSNGQCLPKFEFCNAIPKCSDGSDEPPHVCSSQQSNKKAVNLKRKESCPFECGNGRCRSTAIVCSGRDGCGDNSDEATCSVCSCPAVPDEN